MLDEKTAQTSAHPWAIDGARHLRFGVGGGPFGDWTALRDFVQMAEGLAFDSYWLPDHPLLTPDCWTTLAAIAVSTQRMRIGSMVTCAYYRSPVLLARVVADVDRLSRGRVVLGLGAGDMQDEFEAMGLAWPPVGERRIALASVLHVVQRLLRGDTVTYQESDCRVVNTLLPFLPAQQPHIPIVVAGGGKQTLRLVAQYADASNLVGAEWGGGAASDADVRRKYRVLEEHCATIGRPYTSVLRTYNFTPTVLAESPSALAVKREQVPPRILAFGGAAALVGTPAEAVQRLQPLADAGCQYFILAFWTSRRSACLPSALYRLSPPGPTQAARAQTVRPPSTDAPHVDKPVGSPASGVAISRPREADGRTVGGPLRQESIGLRMVGRASATPQCTNPSNNSRLLRLPMVRPEAVIIRGDMKTKSGASNKDRTVSISFSLWIGSFMHLRTQRRWSCC